jgi:hypothetical protein
MTDPPSRPVEPAAGFHASDESGVNPSSESNRQKITPAERWELIREATYKRAQKRGFVGGYPYQDLLDAEREVDAAHETDYECLLADTEPDEFIKQLRGLFACYGFDQEHLDDLLAKHCRRLQTLIASSRELLPETAELAAKQGRAVSSIASEAIRALQSLAVGRIRPEALIELAEVAMKTLEDALAEPQGLTQKSSKESTRRAKQTFAQTLLRDAVETEYEGLSARELADAPVTAMRGISASLGEKLRQTFSIHTIRDLANHPHAKWASGIVLFADAQQSGRNVSSSPLIDVIGQLSECHGRLLREAFGIETVQDLARDREFVLASAIVLLAESEE